jgi:hypothetical protein
MLATKPRSSCRFSWRSRLVVTDLNTGGVTWLLASLLKTPLVMLPSLSLSHSQMIFMTGKWFAVVISTNSFKHLTIGV